MAADRTHWSECWRVHHECAVTEVERLRAQVADPDGRLWRDRAHDCARDVREALGHERDAHIIWSHVVQMVREQRERTERLEAERAAIVKVTAGAGADDPDLPGCVAELAEWARDWRAIAGHLANGHTDHCAKRLVWGDGECECELTGQASARTVVAAAADERTERLEAIVRGLVHLGPSDTYGSCLLCGTDDGAPHEADCLWLQARQEAGDVG